LCGGYEIESHTNTQIIKCEEIDFYKLEAIQDILECHRSPTLGEKMKRKLLFAILTLVTAEVSAGNRTVAIDDAPGVGNTGWVWNNYLPGGGA
jgi:hypothetical protein